MSGEKKFHCCSLCGKRLIQRKENGLLVFNFGRGRGKNTFIPVNMIIHGSVRMQCMRRSCREEHPDHFEEITLFPFNTQSGKKPE